MDFKIKTKQLRVRQLLCLSALLINVLLFGCKGNEGVYGLDKRDTTAAVRKEIPGGFLSLTIEKQEDWFCNALQIPALTKTYNGLQLRIIEDYRDDNGHLILLNDSNEYWSAHLFEYKTIRDEARKMKALFYRHITLGKPKSGWLDFRKKLFELDMKNLQIERPLIEQFDTESVVMDIKIVAEHKYTHNNFADPYKSKNEHTQKIAGIVSFLKEELLIK